MRPLRNILLSFVLESYDMYTKTFMFVLLEYDIEQYAQ